MSAALEPQFATATEARDLTDRIKIAVDGTWQLIKQAYQYRAWDALGYSSWDDYCTREFGTSRLRLPREERQEVVSSMREIGMSVRAIASATGTNRETVRLELQGDKKLSPEAEQLSPEQQAQYDWADQVARDIGVDLDSEEDGYPPGLREVMGEIEDEYSAPAPQLMHSSNTEESPSRVTGTDGKSYSAKSGKTPNRSPLPPQFVTVANELTKLTTRLEKLQSDDRYRSNRISISDQCVPQYRRAVEVLSDLLDDLASDD